MTYDDTWATRDKSLRRLGLTNYEEFLRSEHWIHMGKKAQGRENYKICEACGMRDGLDLHHSSYKLIGTSRELINVNAFCRKCHANIHNLARESGVSVRICTNLCRAYTALKAISDGSKIDPNFKSRVKALNYAGSPEKANCIAIVYSAAAVQLERQGVL